MNHPGGADSFPWHGSYNLSMDDPVYYGVKSLNPVLKKNSIMIHIIMFLGGKFLPSLWSSKYMTDSLHPHR